MAPFKYEPIDLEGPAFRLVRLLKGNNVENIRCELFQAWLPSVGDGIPYEALSYTWGGTEKPETIEIHGGILNATLNLYLAMQQLRFEHEDRIVWIDAICIDQGNMEERGHQVQQMAEIYHKAEQVLVWLGSGTDETDLFMNSINRLQEEAFKLPCHHWKHSDIRWMEIWSITQLTSGCLHQHAQYQQREGLQLLLRRSWFKRIWILQEVAKARAAVIICGTKSVLARFFALAPSLIGVNPDAHCQAVLDIFPGPSRKDSWWSQKRDLYTLLVKFGKSQATEPRDIIYSLLGMSSNAQDTDRLRPNYSKPMTEVIREVTSFIFSLDQLDKSEYRLPCWTMPKFLCNLNFLSNTVLKWNISKGQVAAIKLLVGHSDFDINLKDNSGKTAFLWAAQRGEEVAVKLLIERKDIDINCKDNKGRTALSWAAERRRIAIVRLLLNHNDIDINSKDKNGRTALSWAAKEGDTRRVKLLVERKDIDVIDINLKDNKGQTAMSWAAQERHGAIERLITRAKRRKRGDLGKK